MSTAHGRDRSLPSFDQHARFCSSLQLTVRYDVEVRSTQHRRKPYAYATPASTQKLTSRAFRVVVLLRVNCRGKNHIREAFWTFYLYPHKNAEKLPLKRPKSISKKKCSSERLRVSVSNHCCFFDNPLNEKTLQRRSSWCFNLQRGHPTAGLSTSVVKVMS